MISRQAALFDLYTAIAAPDEVFNVMKEVCPILSFQNSTKAVWSIPRGGGGGAL